MADEATETQERYLITVNQPLLDGVLRSIVEQGDPGEAEVFINFVKDFVDGKTVDHDSLGTYGSLWVAFAGVFQLGDVTDDLLELRFDSAIKGAVFYRGSLIGKFHKVDEANYDDDSIDGGAGVTGC